ncbi:alkylglycerol monooxygenase [Grus japonensis]|uniref:Alkylglycerol monooxygenase n=1 Tax=Grus japonensis TaxID=30415 RepID=A0ABC9WGF7_GRUJA
MGSEAGGPRATAPGQQLRALFYVLPPGESSFRTVEEVPDYVEKGQDSCWSLHRALYIGRAVCEGPKSCLKHELISY